LEAPSAKVLSTTSVDPPAGQGTIRVIGLVGKSAAVEKKGRRKMPAKTTAPVNHPNPFFLIVLITLLLVFNQDFIQKKRINIKKYNFYLIKTLKKSKKKRNVPFFLMRPGP
jgi:hypothetical protein